MFKLKSSTLTSMFTSFSGAKQSQSGSEVSDRLRPTTPRSLSTDSKSSKMMDHSHSCNSFLSPITPESQGSRVLSGSLGQSGLKGEDDEVNCQSTENLLDRSVKISFPKKGDASGNVMTETVLRKRLVRFGQIMNVGMKEKVAAVLFATSTQALMFCTFHDNCVGPDYKIKYMGTKVVSDTELHLMWQEQQQRNRRSEGSDKLSTSDKASTKFSKSIDTQSPSSRLRPVADGGMAPESSFCTDDYAANEVDLSFPSDPKPPRFHGGSETESENDFEYGVAPRYCQGGGLKDNGQSTDTSSVVCSAPQSPEGWKSLAPRTDKPTVIGIEVKTRELPPAHSKKMANKEDANSTSAYANEEGQEKNTSTGRRRLQIDDCNDYEEGLQISHSTEHKELATPRWHGAAQAMFEGPSLIPESMDAASTGSMRSSRYDKRSSSSSIGDSPSPNYISNDEDLRDANSLSLPSRSSGVVSSSSSMYQTMKLNRTTGSSNRFDGSFSDGIDKDRDRSGSGSGAGSSGQIEAVHTGPNRQSLHAFSPSEAGYSYSGVGRQQQPLSLSDDKDIDGYERKGRSFSQLSADVSFSASRLPLQTNAMSGTINREDRQRFEKTGSVILTEGNDNNSNNHRNRRDRDRDRGYSSSPSKNTYIEPREDTRGVTRTVTERNVRRSHESRSAGNSRFSPNRHSSTGSSRPTDSEEMTYEEDTVEDFVHLRHAMDTLLAKNRVLEKESDLARKRVLQLESESLVKHVEREDAFKAFTSQQNQWTAELTAHILRNTALEQELRSKKEELEGSKIRLAADEAKIKSLTEMLLMSRPDFCGTGMIRAGALNKGQGDEERKDAGVYDADPLSSCFPTNVRSHGVAMMDPYPSHIESKSNAGESYSNSNKKVSLRDSSVMAVRLKFQAPQRPAISPASPSVTFAERAEGHSRRLSVSEALLQDLKATRRQIDALNRMAYSFDANCDSADSEIQQLNKKIWTAESRYRPHIRRVEDSSNIIGHQSVNDWASQDSTFINEAVLPFKGSPVNFRPTQAASHFTPVTSTPTAVHLAPKKSPCPPNLMSYYSHLIPHRDIQTIPPSPGSSTKANKRRAYLARLLDD